MVTVVEKGTRAIKFPVQNSIGGRMEVGEVGTGEKQVGALVIWTPSVFWRKLDIQRVDAELGYAQPGRGVCEIEVQGC